MSIYKPFVKSLTTSLIVAGLLTTLIGGTIYTRVEGTNVDVKRLDIEPKPTIIYDKNGDVMARFRKEKKDVTAYEEIPIEVIQAVISTEDRAFFEHPGINVKAITRAAYAIFQADGALVQGGSTLTQQLAKNIYLTTEKKLDRKIKEAIIATTLEQQLTKEEILAHYLNHNFYGDQAYGIRSAVETYFGQTLEEFNADDKVTRIAKSALLAGLPQLPTAHNPYQNPDSAKQRRDAVLANMWTEGDITKEEYHAAKELPFLILPEPNIVHEDDRLNYGEIVSYVLEETADIMDTDLEGAMYSGREIYTSFDPEVYEILRKHFEKSELFPQGSSNGAKVDGSVSIVNPKNGEVMAMTGGRDKPGFLELNRAYQSKRQPGSSFKSIISYAPALESGKFHPWSVLIDTPTTFAGNYTPKNFSGKGNGKMTMISALQASQNIPAVYLLSQTGIDYSIKFAERLGLEFTDKDRYLPIALGGLSKGVSTLQMADAYQGFTNGGYRVPAHIVKRMVTHAGEVEFEAVTDFSERNKVMKPQTAEYMRYMLQNAVISGTGTQAKIKGELVGGKTGTTDKNKDIWFTGFTSEFVGSVWMGYDNPTELPVTSWVAAKMFSAIGTDIAKIYPDGDLKFTTPKQVKPDIKKVELTGTYDKDDEVVYLQWGKEEDTTYTVFRNGTKIAEKLTEDTYTDKKVTSGETYEYRVVGYNDYTNFETYTSNTISIVMPQTAPPIPSSLESSGAEVNKVALKWSEVAGATNYIVSRNGKVIYSGPNNYFSDEGLTPETDYQYELVAENSNGRSIATKLNVSTKAVEIEDLIRDDEDTFEEGNEESVIEEPVIEEKPKN